MFPSCSGYWAAKTYVYPKGHFSVPNLMFLLTFYFFLDSNLKNNLSLCQRSNFSSYFVKVRNRKLIGHVCQLFVTLL